MCRLWCGEKLPIQVFSLSFVLALYYRDLCCL